MVHRLPITKARINLGAVVKRVHLEKEYVILEKDGIPVAGLMDADELEDYLELRDPKVRAHIQKSAEEHRAGKSRPLAELIEELKREAKPGRSRNPRRRS
jgi:PHD/YefM family antitoxin component YafN of YafNO toxin-antitoxin module